MTCRKIATAALVSSLLTYSAAAQDTVDVGKLPVNLDRIQRQLQQATVREERDGLKLRYVVDVYGRAPQIELFTKQDNLESGPVPYGAPTHRQMIEAVTPQEYRAPAADFNSLFRWLADKAKDKK
jgi:hypothetical protein